MERGGRAHVLRGVRPHHQRAHLPAHPREQPRAGEAGAAGVQPRRPYHAARQQLLKKTLRALPLRATLTVSSVSFSLVAPRSAQVAMVRFLELEHACRARYEANAVSPPVDGASPLNVKFADTVRTRVAMLVARSRACAYQWRGLCTPLALGPCGPHALGADAPGACRSLGAV
jgi:hypothetical protein